MGLRMEKCIQGARAGWRIGTVCAIGAMLGTAACSDGRDTAGLGAGAGSSQGGSPSAVQEGEFVTYVADFEDGHSERWQALRTGDGHELRLALDTPPSIATGSRVRLSGEALGDGTFHVSASEVLSAPQALESAPVPTFAAPPSPDTYALVLVDLGSGVDVDASAATRTMFSTTPSDKSFASYYFESSYGKYTVNGAVLGPYPFSMTTCDTTGMFQSIEAAQATALAPYKHIIYYFAKTSLCTFGGLGEEGSQSAPAKRTWMNGSLGCVVLMQEPGHNLGLMHANTIACGTSSFSTTPSTSCTITEYGNTLTTMGSGCHQNNGYEKWYEQWLSGCNGVRVTSSGTFNLVPLGESCPGAVQVLQIPMPATLTVNDPQATTTTVNLKNYYVELRAAAGSFDQYNAAGRNGGGTYTAPTVLIYASDDVHSGVSTGRGGGGSNSVWTELLNMTPGSTPFTGMTTAGQTFSDPAGGASITLQSISASGAVIGVNVPSGTGGPTCIDGTTLTLPGPACDGGAVVIPPFDAGTVADAASGDAAATAVDGGAAADAAHAADGTVATGYAAAGLSPTEADAAVGTAVHDGAAGSSSAASDAPVWDAPAARSGCGCETVGVSAGGRRAAPVLGGVGLALLALRRGRSRRGGVSAGRRARR